jgi:hypothetical protein
MPKSSELARARRSSHKVALNTSRLSPPAEALRQFLQVPIPLIDRVIGKKLAQEEQAKVERDFGKLRRQQTVAEVCLGAAAGP